MSWRVEGRGGAAAASLLRQSQGRLAQSAHVRHPEPGYSECSTQILAVVVPEGGDSTGARFPQQTETETAVDMHPDLLLCQTSLRVTGYLEQLFHKSPIIPQMFL